MHDKALTIHCNQFYIEQDYTKKNISFFLKFSYQKNIFQLSQDLINHFNHNQHSFLKTKQRRNLTIQLEINFFKS